MVVHRRRGQLIVSALLIIVCVVLAALGIARSQSSARHGIQQRWDARTQLASGFVQTYTAQLFDRESEVARLSLAGRVDDLTLTARAFGFSNAVLLDARGRLLAVYPDAPALLGTAIAGRYPHLTSALAGTRAVSPVVPAAADGAPVVGFAMPFDTPSGRRVFSGAYAVQRTPLAAYLKQMTPITSARIYLVDATGSVITASHEVAGVKTLAALDPALQRASRTHRSGYYRQDGSQQYFSSYPVPGTPWQLLARAPTSALFVSVNGLGRVAPWVLLGVLTVVLAIAVVLWSRRIEDHVALERAYARLDDVASLDGLTQLLNRRSTQAALDALHDAARHGNGDLSVLMVDVDHFKRINDTFGHAAGDAALVATGHRLREALRDQDVLGRWGGEEFLVVLPGADAALAGTVAERLRQAVSAEPIEIGAGGDAIDVTVSIGLASSRDAVPDVLVSTADRALYAAKDAGRNRISVLNP